MVQRLFLTLILSLLCTPGPRAEETGRISGRLTGKDRRGLGGVTVALDQTKHATITDARGAYAFARLPRGTYTVSFTHAGETHKESGVVVTPGATARVDVDTDWGVVPAENLTVYSASRRTERIVEAPAAVTVVNEREIESVAASGQAPKLFEFAPGVEVTQSGLYDYNVNTRGLNSSLNRRILTLIDGRDPSVPFLGAQEWAALSFPLDDLESVELLRGPSAALYGANASGGALSLSRKQARYAPGGSLRLTKGEVGTTHVDFRWAGEVGNAWYLKVVGGVHLSGDHTVSRNGTAEYSVPCSVPQGTTTDCLPQESVALALEDDDEVSFAGIRVDKYLEDGSAVTVEMGWADVAGPVLQTGIGRVQVVDVERPWVRFNYGRDQWRITASHTGRRAPEQLALASDANLALDTDRFDLDVQTDRNLARGRLRIVAGGSYKEEDIDTLGDHDRDPSTPERQTLLFEPVRSDFSALFGQIDWRIHDRLKLALAGRWDDSSLYDSELSPKLSLIFEPHSSHHLRLTYGEAFQAPNVSELFLVAPVGVPVNLNDLEVADGASVDVEALLCTESGVSCGLGTTPVLGLGNKNLDLEHVRVIEVGYKGVIGPSTSLGVDYYSGETENLITDLLPNVGTPLGRLNQDYGAWQGPPNAETTDLDPDVAASVEALLGLPAGTLSGTVAHAVRVVLPSLSNDPSGAAVMAELSYTNFGQADTQGVDVELTHHFRSDLVFSFSYSWFDFDATEPVTEASPLLLPNSPEHKCSMSVGYGGDRLDAGVRVRWSDAFRWATGPFRGDVEAYTTVDLNASYRFGRRWSVGMNVANLFDDRHWESFGGDVLRRRALGHLTFEW